MEETSHVLEINLISAQGLMELSSSVKPQHHLKTYAVASVDSSTKLRSRVDRVGGDNPTWNDKFLFKVSSKFLFSKTSTFSVEIYAFGMFRDRLIGSVRIFVSNFLQPAASVNGVAACSMKTPAFLAHLIRSPSGEFFGILNVGGMVLDGSGFQQTFRKVSGIDYRDLTGKNNRRPGKKKSSAAVSDIMEFQFRPLSEIGDCDSHGDSLTSSSSPPHAALRVLSLKGKNEKETNSFEEEKEEMVKLEEQLPATIDSVPGEITEEMMVFGNEEIVGKMEKDVKMTMEENKKLREMVEMLMVEVKKQSTVVSDLHGRVKILEKKSRKIKQRKPRYVKPKSSNGLQGKPSAPSCNS